MALRLRLSGELVCAAESEPMDGDVYITDREHYDAACQGLLKTSDGLLWKRGKDGKVS